MLGVAILFSVLVIAALCPGSMAACRDEVSAGCHDYKGGGGA